MTRRVVLAVTIAAALFGLVVAPVLAQNSEAAPAAAALMKSKLKAPAGGTVTVKVTNWREADLVELQVVESGSASWKKVLGVLKAGQWTWAKAPQGEELSCRSAREIRGHRAECPRSISARTRQSTWSIDATGRSSTAPGSIELRIKRRADRRAP